MNFLPKKLREKITALVELHNVSQMNVNVEFYQPKSYVNFLPKKLREKITALVELDNVSQMNVNF